MSYNRAGASSRDRGRDPPKWLNRNRAYDRNRDDDRNRNRDGNRYNDWNRDRGRNRLNNYSTNRERDRWRDRGRDRDSDQENERVRERDRDNDRDPKGEKKDESRDSKNSSIEEQFKQLFTRIGSTLGLEDLDSLTPDEGLSILQENVSSILGDKVKIELEEDDKKSDEGMLSPQLQILKLLEKLESVIQKNLVAAEANVNDEGIFPTSDQLIEQKSRSRSPDKSETASEKQTAENNSRRRSRDRSRSISRKSRSKSPSTSRRSRSKSLSKPRRSRSKSPLRSKRSRSKSPLRSRRSKSRSPSWRHRRGGYKLRRSRSKSISLSPPRYSRRRVTSPLRYGNRRRSYSPPVRWRRTPSRSPPRPPPPTLNTPWQPTNYYPQPDPTLEVGSYGVTPSYAGGIQNYIAPQPPNYYDGGQLGGYPPPMDYSGGMPPWHPPNMMPPPGINPHVPRPQLPVPESKDNITVDLTSSENNTQPPKNVVDSEEAKNLAIENEAAQQRITLINQRAEYLKKRDTLQRDLKMLQNQKKAILMDKASPENESVLKENHTLQTEINNKLKAIGNVIDMLDSIIRPKKEDEEDIKKTEENKDLEAIGNVIGVLNNIIGPKGKEDGEVAKTVESDTSSKEPRQRSKSPVAGRKLPDEQTPPPEQKKSPEKPQFNYVYYDPELHWCKVCNTFPRTAKEFLHHMHSEEHKNITKERNIQDFPWHKFQEPDDPKAASDAPVKRVPIKGLQFFISSTAWYCKLCDHWIGDLHCASRHLKSAKHSKAYNDFIVEHPNWELDWLANRSRAYEKKADEKQLKEESQQLNEKQKVIPNSETLQTMEKVPQEDASISSSNQEDAREKLRRALSLSIGQKIKAVLVKKENDRNKSKNNDRHKSVPNKRARSGSSSSRSSDSNHDQKRRSKDKHKKKLDRDSIPKEKKLTKPPHIMVQVPDLKCRWDEPATPADNRSSSKDRFDDKEWMSEPKSTVEGELLHKKQELKTQIKQRVDQDEKHYIKQSEIQMKQNRRERDKDDSKTRSEKEDNKKRDKGIKKPSKVLQHKGIKENNSDAEVEKHTKKEPGLSDDSDEKDISLNAQKDLAKKPVIKIVNPKSPFIGKMPFLDKFLAKKKKELDKELVIKEEEVPAALDCGTSSSQTVVTTQQIPLPQKMTASQPMPPPKELPPPKIPLPSQMPTSQEIPPLQQRSSSSPPQTFVTTQQMPPPQKSLLAAEKFSMPPLPQTAVTIQQMPPPQQSLLIAQDFSLPPPQALVITQQMPPPHQSPLTAQDFSVLPPQTVVTTQQMPPPQQSSLTAQDFSVPPPQALVTTQQMPPPNLLTPPPPPPLPVPPPVVEMDPCRPIMRPIRPLMGPLGPLDIPPGPPRMRPPGPPGMGSGPPRMRPPGPPGMGPPGPPRMCPPGMGSGPPRMCPPGPPGMGPPGPSTNCQNNKKTSSSIKWVIYKNEDGDSKKKEPSKKPEEAQKREESKKEEDDKKRMELELLGIDADDMAAHDFVL